MMRNNRSMEPVLKIKIQSYHTFLIHFALATILPLIDQNTNPFEEFDSSYFQTPHALKNNGLVSQISSSASLSQLVLLTFPISVFSG